MTNKIGPKEKALQAAREEHAGIPDFLKRTETKAKKKKADPDPNAGLTVIEPVDPKIRKAIEKDFAEPKPTEVEVVVVGPLEDFVKRGQDTQFAVDKVIEDHSKRTTEVIENQTPSIKRKAKKTSRALQKALAAREKLNQTPKHSAAANPMEATVKKSKTAKKVAKAPAKKANGNGDSKKETVIAMLKKGATMDALAKATGWTKHSLHGLFSGTLRNKMKLKIQKEQNKDGDYVYSIG